MRKKSVGTCTSRPQWRHSWPCQEESKFSGGQLSFQLFDKSYFACHFIITFQFQNICYQISTINYQIGPGESGQGRQPDSRDCTFWISRRGAGRGQRREARGCYFHSFYFFCQNEWSLFHIQFTVKIDMSQTKKQLFFTPLSLGCDWSERQALGALGTTLAGQDDQVWE